MVHTKSDNENVLTEYSYLQNIDILTIDAHLYFKHPFAITLWANTVIPTSSRDWTLSPSLPLFWDIIFNPSWSLCTVTYVSTLLLDQPIFFDNARIFQELSAPLLVFDRMINKGHMVQRFLLGFYRSFRPLFLS